MIALNRKQETFEEGEVAGAIEAARTAFSTRRKTLRRVLANRYKLGAKRLLN